MVTFVARRLFFLVQVMVGIAVITFLVSHAIPGDPARLAAGAHATEAQVQSLRHAMGLDRSLPVQFAMYVRNCLHGDLGTSILTRRPVLDDLRDYFPATLELTISAMLIVVLVGIPLGIFSAVHQDKWPDHVSRVFSLAGTSTPLFWLGFLLQLCFFRLLGVFPLGGRIDQWLLPPARTTGLYVVDSLLAGDWSGFASCIWHLALPAFTLAYSSLAFVTRMLRSGLIEVMRKDYIRTARSKGLSERTVLYRHALKNALIPTLTVLGVQFGFLLSGAVMVETVFSWPGIGLYSVQAITSLDFPAIMGFVLLITPVYVLVNLGVDVAYACLNPRIRY